MAAPLPPPAGAGAGAGAGGVGAPPSPFPGRGLGAPPPPPPGSGPEGPNLLAQLVQAMQLAAAALPPPGPGAPPRVKIPPPIFKGLPGERPEAHLMRANDWMDTYLIPVVQKPAPNTSPNFSFTPGQDDIEAYIRDIKEAAHQLNYNDEVMLHLIKATMPAKIYGTLYNQNDLNVVITMVKDIYAKKPEPVNQSGATGGSSAPFTLIKAPNGTSKRVHFQADESLSDRIDRLTDTLYRMDIDSKPVRKPYKPYITSP